MDPYETCTNAAIEKARLARTAWHWGDIVECNIQLNDLLDELRAELPLRIKLGTNEPARNTH